MLVIELQLTILKVKKMLTKFLKKCFRIVWIKCDISDKDQVIKMLDEIKNKFVNTHQFLLIMQ